MSAALRSALLELGDVPPPPDLAGGALARARRDRRRGVAGIVAVLTAAAVTVPVVVLGRPDPAPPAAAPAPHFLVVGFASRDPDEPTLGLGSYQVYRRSGGYVGTPWRAAVPSPDGRTVAVTAPGGKAGIVPADRVGDPAAVRWVLGTARVGVPVWSPDSRRLYVPGWLKVAVRPGDTQEVTAFGYVVDARTLSRREVRLTSLQAGKGTGRVVFGPGGSGFAVAPDVRSGRTPEPVTTGLLQLFDERGAPLRRVRIGPAAVPDQPFSPDGRLLATHVGGRPALYVGGSTRVLDLASGAEVGTADGDVVAWYDDSRYVVRAGRAIRLVDLASGRVLGERQLVAAGREVTGVWLAPLDGPPPPGAIVL